MPKKFLKRFLPPRSALHDRWFLRPFEAIMHDPALWHFNRRGTCKAFAIGLFMAWVPVPFQMALAGLVALLIRVNLPVAIFTVWLSNPITIAPFFYFAYQVGNLVLGQPDQGFEFKADIHWLLGVIAAIWKPLITGSLLLGIFSAAIGYFLLNYIWMQHAMNRYRKRNRPTTTEPG